MLRPHGTTVLVASGMLALSCATTPKPRPEVDTYLRNVAFEIPVNQWVTLRWPEQEMPLKVFLPPPPAGLFRNAEAIHDSVRDGVLDWTEVVGPGVPNFVFVDAMADADIPIVWAEQPDGDWYIAHCAYDIDSLGRRFGVSRILLTARYRNGSVADLQDIYETMLHEMGHALGLGGHSPFPDDIMFRSTRSASTTSLSERDKATLRALYARPIGARISGAYVKPR